MSTQEEIVRMGFELGYNQPEAEPGIPLDEPQMSWYRQAMEAGRQARQEADAEYTGPAVGPAREGQTWDEYNEYTRNCLEVLFHKHMPHIEVPEFDTSPPVE